MFPVLVDSKVFVLGLSQLTEAQRKALTAQAEANKVSDDADPLADNNDVANDLVKKGLIKPVQLTSDVSLTPTGKVRKIFAIYFLLLDNYNHSWIIIFVDAMYF